MKSYLGSLLAIGLVSAQADILPGSLPLLTPFEPGLTEVTYVLALTTQTIEPQSEFVILDVVGLDHWNTPAGLPFSLTVERVTDLTATYNGNPTTPYDDPLKDNLRFTYLDLTALTGPRVLMPLSGFIFDESEELTLRSQSFATHAYQLAEEIQPMVHRVSRHAIIPVPEASTWTAGIVLASLVGSQVYRRRS